MAKSKQQYVPVVTSTGKPLMPTTPSRAYWLMRYRGARPFWKKGIFCLKLKRKDGEVQPVAAGCDPGSKMEAFTVKSETKTFLNVQTEAITNVKARLETRRNLRKNRRSRNTPYRKCRWNRARSKGWIPPSTRARWDHKVRLLSWLKSIYPITILVIEDIAARTKSGSNAVAWNKSFSPIQAGKQYGYAELRKVVPTITKQGHETHKSRNDLGLAKLKDKMSYRFNAHCVDSWTLAAMEVGGARPDNTAIYRIKRIEFGRRNLHKQNPLKGGLRRVDGGTIVLPGRGGIRKGDLLRRLKDGRLFAASGNPENGLSLHDLRSCKRVAQSIKFKRLLEFQHVCRNRYWFSWA
mgnify:CR=1 FL=1